MEEGRTDSTGVFLWPNAKMCQNCSPQEHIKLLVHMIRSVGEKVQTNPSRRLAVSPACNLSRYLSRPHLVGTVC
jgi:hypothetical protein